MRLTKDQRFTAYCIMLAEAGIYKEARLGLCHLIKDTFWIEVEACKRNFIESFPELYSKKPKELYGSWWFHWNAEGWVERIKLLKQCIIETYP